MSYSPQLNVRTAYNFQESLIRVEEYLDFCSENNFSFAFYSDKNSMYGAAEFSKLAKIKNIKPILGVTIEIAETTIVFLAKNHDGYVNLCYISSWLVENETADLEETFIGISQFLTENLVLIANDKAIQKFIKNSILEEDQYLNKIQMNRISYLQPAEKKAFQVITALKENLKLSEIPQLKDEHYPTDEAISKENLFTKQKEIINEIAAKIDFSLFDKKIEPHLIEFRTPNQLPAATYLKQLTVNALETLFLETKKEKSIPQEYKDRLKHELSIIEKMGFANYFLVVWDYVQFAKNNHILVGPGRGSAAGSLVSFLLGITEVDPIAYDLVFERFLNPERETMPDIDIDFQDNRRDEVIEYLFNKYGQFHLATIVTYQTIGAKSAIRDVARVYDLDLEIVNVITKNIGFYHQNNLKKAIAENKILKSYSQKYPEIFQAAEMLLGLPRQTGTHAAGLIFTEDDLRNHLPIRFNYDGIAQTQFDMNYLEDLGLIKMDLLGLRNLSTLKTIQDNIFRNQNLKIELERIPLADQTTFELLQKGDTSGIFQLESPGMLKVVQSLVVNSIEDISAASALFRPGPQEMIPEFVRRKNQKTAQKSYAIETSLEPILGSTYGIIVYQEQVLQVLQKVGNLSLGNADVVRRAMSKKIPSYMQKAQEKFLIGAIENNYSKTQALKIWDWIDQFANYGFNKSHSIAYSYISYWLAYFKAHYPLEFYAALLSGVQGNESKTSQYLQEAQNLKIKIVSPNVKNIQTDYSLANNTLYLPLTLIKGVGPEFVRRLHQEANLNPELFTSIFHFLHGMVNKGLTNNIYQALVWSGALDFFGYDRSTLSANEEVLFNFAKVSASLSKLNPSLYPILEKAKVNITQQADNEKKYYGFFLSTHPLKELRKKTNNQYLIPLNNLKHEREYQILVMVNQIRIKKDKNGQEMAFLSVSDETGSLSLTIFSKSWQLIKQEISEKVIIWATIKVENFQGKQSAMLRKLNKTIKL